MKKKLQMAISEIKIRPPFMITQGSMLPIASEPKYINGVVLSLKPQCLYNSRSTVTIMDVSNRRSMVVPVNIRPINKLFLNTVTMSSKPDNARKYPVMLASMRNP